MVSSRLAAPVIVLTAITIAATAGHQYFGWFGSIAWGIAVVPLLGFAVIGSFIIALSVQYVRHRRRVSHLSMAQLSAIVAQPANTDFRFAHSELMSHGVDTHNIQLALLLMLNSSDWRERQIGLARLREIHPQLRQGIDLAIEESPEQLHAQVRDLLEEHRQS